MQLSVDLPLLSIIRHYFKGLFLKKIILLFLLFSFSILFAKPSLDEFIDRQIKIEKKLVEQNLTVETRLQIKKEQSREYQEFFLLYAANKAENLKEENPYDNKINKLKLRMQNNKRKGYTNAYIRDELQLQLYHVRQALFDTLSETLRLTENKSKVFFKDKVVELMMEQFRSFKHIDKTEIEKIKFDPHNEILVKIQKNLHELNYIENLTNTFAAELVDNSSNIFRSASLSDSKIFTLINSVNNTSFGQKVNVMLAPFDIDSGRVLLVFIIILMIIFIQKLVRVIIDRILHHYKISEKDIDHIHTHITKIFNILTSLIIIHLIIVAVIGLDSKSINISRILSIVYIILTTIILYRVTNTFAYMKMHKMKKTGVLKDEVFNLSLKTINGLIILIAIIAILKSVGVNLTAVLSGLGIAGAAVAFAAKDSIANIFGSIAILAGDIFEQGDWIETGDVDGTVVEIGLRATTIRTFDNALISVPNVELSNASVKNWSKRSIGRRIKMNIGVTYESKFEDIQNAILDIRTMLRAHPSIANENTSFRNSDRQAKLVSIEDLKGIKRTTLVYMDEFSDSSINILVYCFTRSVDWTEWLSIKEDVMYKIAEILERNNLEFAYPTMVIHKTEKKLSEEE